MTDRNIIGKKSIAASTGAVTTTDHLMSYVKQLVTEGIARDAALAVVDAYHDVAVADAVTNAVMSDVIGNKTDAAAADAVTETESLMAYAKQLVTLGIARDVVLAALTDQLALRCCVKADGAVLTGDDDLFVISGGPVRARIVGIVTTVLVGASNGDLQIDVTTPAATIDLNAAPVAIDADAAGTMYYNVGATSVFTPVSQSVVLVDPVTIDETYFLLPPGTVIFRSSAAQTGVIAWYMTYEKLSPDSVVVAAA